MGKKVRVAHEIPRAICEKLGLNEFYQRKLNSLAKQVHLLFEQLTVEATMDTGGLPVVWDRCLLDHYAYTRLGFGEELAATRLGYLIEERLPSLVARYRQIFYLPVEIRLVGDEVRESDVSFQKAVDQEILALLKKFRPDFITLSGSVEERFSKLAPHLSL